MKLTRFFAQAAFMCGYALVQMPVAEAADVVCVHKQTRAMRFISNVSSTNKCKSKTERTIPYHREEPRPGSIWLSPKELVPEQDVNTPVVYDGYPDVLGSPTYALVWGDETVSYKSVTPYVQVPSGQDDASSWTVSLYWVPERADGDVLLSLGLVGQKEGRPLEPVGCSSGGCKMKITPTAAGTLHLTTITVVGAPAAIVDAGIMQLLVERYTVNGSSENGDDTNTGEIYILGVKITPNFD